MGFWNGLVKGLAGVAKVMTPPWLGEIISSGGPNSESERLQEKIKEIHTQTTKVLTLYQEDLETYRNLVYGSSYFLVLGNGIFMEDDSFSSYSSSIDKYSQDPSTALFSSHDGSPVQSSAAVGIPASHDPEELPGRAASLSVRASRAVPHLDLLTEYLRGDPTAREGGFFGPRRTEQLVGAGRSCGIIPAPSGDPITEDTVGLDVGVDAVQQVLAKTSLIGLATPGMEFLRLVGLGQLLGGHTGPDMQKIEQVVRKSECYLQELAKRLEEVRALSEQEIDLFVRMLRELDRISGQQPINAPEPNAVTPRSFLPVMEQAMARYSTFIDIRNAWVRANKRNPNIPVDDFVKDFRTLYASDLSEEQIRRYLNVLSQYSTMISRFTGAELAASS